MTHIVHVVESLGAGVLSMVMDIANQQVRDGYRVSLIYSIRDETPANWHELFDARIESHFLPMVRTIHPIRDIQSAWQLWGRLKRLQPDVVHLHSSKAGAIGRLVSLFYRRTRYFFSPHGLSFLQNDGSIGKQRIFLCLEKCLARCPATIIACSASEAEEVRRHLTAQVRIVENAVDAGQIPVKRQLNSRLRIGSVGRICPQKHPEAMAAIARACRHLPVDFFWIGAGDASGEAVLQAAGVLVTGWMPRTEVLTTLSSWDIYLQTSRWEGMPVAVIEAMLAGLPTVVSNVTGNRDVVLQGKTGFIANNPEEFLRAIQLLTDTPDTILSMGQAARASALTRFSIARMTQSLYQVYGLST